METLAVEGTYDKMEMLLNQDIDPETSSSC
jgi:hypothetical protein